MFAISQMLLSGHSGRPCHGPSVGHPRVHHMHDLPVKQSYSRTKSSDPKPVRTGVALCVSSPDASTVERHQPQQRQLSKAESTKLRKASQQLGKEICTLNIGRAGITSNTIVSLGDALAGNELVKVCTACRFFPLQRANDPVIAALIFATGIV